MLVYNEKEVLVPNPSPIADRRVAPSTRNTWQIWRRPWWDPSAELMVDGTFPW